MNETERQQRMEVVAAFADGERVDTEALRAALADDAGRDYLVDLIAMRELARGVATAPAFSDARPRPAARQYRFTALAAAAAMIVTVGLGGFVLGQQRSPVVSVAVRPPLDADVFVAVETPPPATLVIPLGSGISVDGGR